MPPKLQDRDLKQTTLRINRVRYAELKRIAEIERLDMYEILDQAMRLRIDQFIRSVKRSKNQNS